MTPLATPTGWEVSNLPGTVTINGFHSGSLPVVLNIPSPVIDQPNATAEEKLTIVVTSQRNGSNQAVIQLRFVTVAVGTSLQLPMVYR